MMPADFLPEADQEMLEAARYYQSLSSGLGDEYLAEVEHAVQSIASSPKHGRFLKAILEDGSSKDSPSALYIALNRIKS
jgi:hypothetical protein